MGYEGYKDTWDRRIYRMICRIQGYVGYKDTWDTRDTRIRGIR